MQHEIFKIILPTSLRPRNYYTWMNRSKIFILFMSPTTSCVPALVRELLVLPGWRLCNNFFPCPFKNSAWKRILILNIWRRKYRLTLKDFWQGRGKPMIVCILERDFFWITKIALWNESPGIPFALCCRCVNMGAVDQARETSGVAKAYSQGSPFVRFRIASQWQGYQKKIGANISKVQLEKMQDQSGVQLVEPVPWVRVRQRRHGRQSHWRREP